MTKSLVEIHPQLARVVTATSRPIRSGEEHGREYYFFTKDEFLNKVVEGEILEHTYVELRDVYYGTYKPDLERKIASGKTIILNTDIVGVRFFRKEYHVLAIFIDLPSLELVRTRLKKRNPEMTSELIELRVRQAEMEIANERGEYDYHVLNQEGELDATLVRVEEILRKEVYI